MGAAQTRPPCFESRATACTQHSAPIVCCWSCCCDGKWRRWASFLLLIY